VRHDVAVTVKHATASVFVFCRMAQGWRIGLIRHPRFGRLMMPGGHVEPDESQAEAALREVAEESGLAVRLVDAPSAPLPEGFARPRVPQPWWIVEHPVPADNHLAESHIHVDHLYVAQARGAEPVTEPAHPFGWYAAAELPALAMFDDARILALALLGSLDRRQVSSPGDPESGPGDPADSLTAAAILGWPG
jgi:8-oxo-dGTP pyrophosphatase MutT (NUDIX family)